MGMPLIEKLSMIEVPYTAPPNTCDALAKTESAWMPDPATFRFTLPSDATESTSSGQLIVPALRTSAVTKEGTFPVSIEVSKALLMADRGPRSASVGVPGSKLVAPKTIALTTLASPATVCASPVAGHAHIRARVIKVKQL